MATPTNSNVSPTCFLYASLLLVLCPFFTLKKIDALEGNLKSLHFHELKVSSFVPSPVCNRFSSKAGRKGSSLEVVHRYGPCNGQEAVESPSEADIFLQDQQRVNFLHNQYSFSRRDHATFLDMKTTVPAKSGKTIGGGNYIVTVGLGTPTKQYSLVFDTGSSIAWTQCEPCLGYCYPQQEPKFDPTKSTSYKNVTCSSPSCSLITESRSGVRGCSSPTCLYRVRYGDQSFTVGFLATEKLTISSSDVIDNFVFGCGQNNRGLFRGFAGLLGLGPSKISFVGQTATKYKQLFSYCLPSSPSSTGFLNFGGQVSSTAKFTPLSALSQRYSLYFLDITGISVDGQLLPVNSSVYSNAKTVIDSGTVISRLPPSVYSKLSSAFQSLMTKYPKTNGVSLFDTCYDFTGYRSFYVPKISVFFKGGVEVNIPPTGVMIPYNEKTTCLAFAANGDDTDISIFGNTQQQTLEVIHDVGNGRVGFAPGACP
ncbi:hypothetical protein K2173_000300 [Erythroxylum novogranatense]|uniref:Peptidase A1 domain-containing protein n=1 Tax=Erythroxylum novogranatense TaxID=1862640 RepID=A0AAV8SXE0_9ROSI|nr:hypothetical protein K2173_000300 [Erythroxylum novogranatense]